MHGENLYSHYSSLQNSCGRCFSTHCSNREKYKEVLKNMTCLKTTEIFGTKRALQISACLTNTVKPNYEINIHSISTLIFLAIIYNNKTAVKYLIWLLDCEESTDHSLEICALNYSQHGSSCFLQLMRHHNFPITKNQTPCEPFQWLFHVTTEWTCEWKIKTEIISPRDQTKYIY